MNASNAFVRFIENIERISSISFYCLRYRFFFFLHQKMKMIIHDTICVQLETIQFSFIQDCFNDSLSIFIIDEYVLSLNPSQNVVLTQSITGGFLVLLIIGLKPLIDKRLNAALLCYVWGVVVMWLIIPFIPDIPIFNHRVVPLIHMDIISAHPVDIKNTLPNSTNLGNISINPLFYPMQIKQLITLPDVDFNSEEYKLIFIHELTHYKRRGLWYKMLALAANTIHWFNPLTYISVKNINEACECACDEAVICNMVDSERKYYGEIILNLITLQTDRNMAMSTALSGIRKIERRLSMIMKFRKPKKSVMILA